MSFQVSQALGCSRRDLVPAGKWPAPPCPANRRRQHCGFHTHVLSNYEKGGLLRIRPSLPNPLQRKATTPPPLSAGHFFPRPLFDHAGVAGRLPGSRGPPTAPRRRPCSEQGGDHPGGKESLTGAVDDLDIFAQGRLRDLVGLHLETLRPTTVGAEGPRNWCDIFEIRIVF